VGLPVSRRRPHPDLARAARVSCCQAVAVPTVLSGADSTPGAPFPTRRVVPTIGTAPSSASISQFRTGNAVSLFLPLLLLLKQGSSTPRTPYLLVQAPAPENSRRTGIAW
jgi:hypothetical protein